MTAPIELRKIAYRQTKEGIVISFLVHPNDMAPELAEAAIGARFGAVLVELGDDEQPVERHKQNPLVQRAGILCNETLFQKFIEEEFPLDWETVEAQNFWRVVDSPGEVVPPSQIAATVIRKTFNIDSRREFAFNTEAAAKFDALLAKFEMWKRGQ